MKINYIKTPTIKEFLKAGKEALKQLEVYSKNEFRYKEEVELLATQFTSNISYVFESISMRLEKENFKKLQDFIKELKSLNFESEYWVNIIENFKRSFSIIERYGKDEDLLILENKGA